MAEISIKPEREYLHEIVTKIKKGIYGVPSFQRSFVWRKEQVLDLFVQLNQTRHVAIIMISHNLDLLRAYCSRVYVMYAGRIVESGNADAVFNDPKHPYTKALLSLIPGLEVDKTKPLAELPGMVPEKDRDRTSCIFAPRCPKASDACGQTIQPMDDNDRYILCPFADSKPKEVA